MSKKITYLILAVLIIGAGYWYFTQHQPVSTTPSQTQVTQNVPATETPKPTAPEVITPTTSAPTNQPAVVDQKTTQSPVIDDTWKTYTDKAKTFEFKWPTKGRYAPTWEVKFSDSDCAVGEDGQTGTKTIFEAGGQSFCHMSFMGAAAGTAYLTDVYTTKIDEHFVAIGFSKKVYSAGALNCDFANQYPYSTSASTCVAFDQNIYASHLDQIIGTFKNLQ